MNFTEWIAHGVTERWVTMPICATHSEIPLRDWEAEEMYSMGHDPCLFVLRLWNDGMGDE